MSDERAKEKLALEGGLKAVGSIQGKGKPKVGLEEFMAIAERFEMCIRDRLCAYPALRHRTATAHHGRR